ncbi:MFS family permease [Streptomyces demainii]|uniref:MFS family permease n=1 Tax=Streptomyces demainii TaxID=588122 RepID=A0ABT9KQS2_9ACTN|nr:MFS family permease [Streptomyces demainii]
MTVVDAGERGAGKAAVPGWRGGFGRLWGAAVVSRFGDALRGAALPLLAVSLTDSPVLVSLVTACGFLPWLLFGLIGGAIADRVDQRRAMWAVDGLRAVLMAGFAVAVWLDRASIGLLLVLAFALTTLQTLFDNAATALLPSVVGQEALGRANARLMTGQEVMGRFVGAPLVPVLLGLGAAMPYAADAVTYLVAAVLVASLGVTPPRREPRAPGGSLRRDIAEGLAVLWRDRTLRALCVSTTLCNVGIGALIATLVLHITGWLDAGNAGYAVVITVYGIGSVTGGLLAARFTEKLGNARALVVCGTAQIGALVVLGAIRSLPARGRRHGPLRLRGDHLERDRGDDDPAAQPRGHTRPGERRLPHPVGRGRPARRAAGRGDGRGMGAQHTRAGGRGALRMRAGGPRSGNAVRHQLGWGTRGPGTDEKWADVRDEHGRPHQAGPAAGVAGAGRTPQGAG